MRERRYTPEQWADAEVAARATLANIERRKAGKAYSYYGGDPVQRFATGYMAEWLVADDLGLPRPEVGERGDGGVDLTGRNGDRLQVRCREGYGQPLLCPAERPIPRTADWFVLVWHEPGKLTIAGVVAKATFKRRATKENYGYGPCWAVQFEHLDPWEEHRSKWARPCPPPHRLVEWLAGEQRNEDKIAAHVVECRYCRIAVGEQLLAGTPDPPSLLRACQRVES